MYSGSEQYLIYLISHYYSTTGTTCSGFYNFTSLVYIPDMYNKREEVAKTVQDYFNSVVKPLFLNIPAYTVDLVLSPDLSRVRVIEINHPPPVAGTSLFKYPH